MGREIYDSKNFVGSVIFTFAFRILKKLTFTKDFEFS